MALQATLGLKGGLENENLPIESRRIQCWGVALTGRLSTDRGLLRHCHVIQHQRFRCVSLFWSKETGFLRGVRKKEEAYDANDYCEGAFDEEYP